MGTILASSLIARASEIAGDESNVVWLKTQALEWVSDAQIAVAIVRHDSYTETKSILLKAGTKQTITGHRLLTVIRNMGSDGATPGRSIRLVDRGAKDEFEPNWHSADPEAVVKEYVYDDRVPKRFYVSPPVIASTQVYVETEEEETPTPVANIEDPIVLDDIYSTAMIEWICYRFFSRDSEVTPNIPRAIEHFKNFFMLLGEKMKSDMATSPKVRAHLE
ncbi:MAG TPA: hypothetical protein ENJ35_04205 [Gammaproteobacteria bacterium]|nr:hypothetical protein [Gammaproteobacteria bacterium]